MALSSEIRTSLINIAWDIVKLHSKSLKTDESATLSSNTDMYVQQFAEVYRALVKAVESKKS